MKKEKELKEGVSNNDTPKNYSSQNSASSEYHFDPEKGVVNAEGEVMIDKEEYMKRLNLDGIAISI